MSKMTNKEALDLIQHKLNLAVDDPLIMTDKEYEVFSLCAKALEKVPKWIPCSERLPKEGGLYLVSVKNEHDRRYSKTCWFHGDDNWFARQDVIAWMPLPEPYKAESEV